MTYGERGGIVGIFSYGTNLTLKVGLIPMETTIFSPIVSFANSAKNLFFFNFTFQYFSSAMFLLHMLIKFGQKPKLHLADLAGQVFILILVFVLQENSKCL